MWFYKVLWFLLAGTVFTAKSPTVQEFGSEPVNASVDVIFDSDQVSLDAPHISAINATNFQWWYFDAVSADLSTAIVIVFFATTSNGFPLVAGIPSDVSVAVSVKLPNGTTLSAGWPVENATITSEGVLGDGVAGSWGDVGAFAGSPTSGTYGVNFDLSQNTPGIKGSLGLKSTATSGNPCPNRDLQVMPHLGWTNAVPDAIPTSTFTLNDGTTYHIANGSGYHDQNWGDIPFPETLSDWYWGHLSLGPWSIVFFSGNDPSDKPYAIAEIYRHGRRIVSSCEANSIEVTANLGPKGEGDLVGLNLTFPIGGGIWKTRTLKVEFVPNASLAAVQGYYYRWSGGVTGGLMDGEQYEDGIGIAERFQPI